MPYRTIDLCAGIGGIRKGFERTGKYLNVLSSNDTGGRFCCVAQQHNRTVPLLLRKMQLTNPVVFIIIEQRKALPISG